MDYLTSNYFVFMDFPHPWSFSSWPEWIHIFTAPACFCQHSGSGMCPAFVQSQVLQLGCPDAAAGWVTQDLHRWVILSSSGKNTSIVQQSPEQLILIPCANCCPIKCVLVIDVVPQIPWDTSRSVKIRSFINTTFSFFLSLSAPLLKHACGQGEPCLPHTSSTSL